MAGIEILGAFASAVQLVDICLRATESLSTFFSRVIDVPISISKKKAHLARLVQTLRLIQHCPSLQTSVPVSILTSLTTEVRALQDILGKVTPEATAGKAKIYWKSLDCAFKEKKILSVCRRLEEEKSALTLCIATINFESLRSVELEVVKVQCKVNDVFKELPTIRNTAQNVTSILEDIPKLTSQMRYLHYGIPDIVSKVTTIENDIPVIARKVDFIYNEIPTLRKSLERLEVSE